MSYNYLTQFDSPNYTPGSQTRATWGRDRNIEAIAIHWWGDPNQNPQFMNIVNYLCRAGGNSSAHYVATGTGRQVACIVSPFDNAWATNSANPYTVSIECDPRCRDEDYDVVAELVADIRSAFGANLPLVAHRQFTSTACPGNWDLNRINDIAAGKISQAEWGQVTNKESKVLATRDQVAQLYREVLEREVDPAGMATYANTRFTVDEARNDLRNSNEYRQLQANKAASAEAAAQAEAAKRNFTLASTTDVTSKKFKVKSNTQLVVVPDNTRTDVKGTIDYNAGTEINFAELLKYINGNGEARSFYRTAFWKSKGSAYGFNADAIEEVNIVTNPEIPVVEPEPEIPTPTPETPTPEKPDYDKENNGLLKTILSLLNGLVEAFKSIFKTK